MDLELQNKAVIITGGAAGIGAACVRAFAAEGARVAFLDRDNERGQSLADELKGAGAAVLFLPAELTDERSCRDAVLEVERVFGRIDVLVNNAGINDSISLESSPAEFRASLEKNLVHVFAVTHFAREALIATRGTIVNLGSKVAMTGFSLGSDVAAYVAKQAPLARAVLLVGIGDSLDFDPPTGPRQYYDTTSNWDTTIAPVPSCTKQWNPPATSAWVLDNSWSGGPSATVWKTPLTSIYS